MLEFGDKLAIARGLMELRGGAEGDDGESVTQWYRRTRQTERAIRHLWEPLVIATLNDSSEHCSMKYAGKVFYELFLKDSTGGRLGIPTVPLSDFYEGIADFVRAHGGCTALRASVEQIAQQQDGRWLLRAGDRDFVADDVVLALPFEQTQRLVAGMSLNDAAGEGPRRDLLDRMGRFGHSPYVSILLWFDREITDVDHAWLLDSTLHWFFHKSRIRGHASERGSYVELVISGSPTVLTQTREEILTLALGELARFFPEAARARLVKSGILKEARATFAVAPGLDWIRPSQRTAWPGLYLAGDWTATDWPSTMEGAARSGRLASGEVVGERERFLAAELKPTGISRWMARDR